MSNHSDQHLLDVLLNSWNRNNTILINLLRAIPPHLLEVKAMTSSPSVAQLFTHIHFVRLVFIAEDAPEFAEELPAEEWASESDPRRIEEMLNHSGTAVRQVVKNTFEAGKALQLHYDHPVLFLQHMLWHEGYHHGQIKLALKLAGCSLTDEQVGPLTWRIWMDKIS